MTPAEVAFLLEMVEKRWPHAPLPLGSADVWLEDLKGFPAAECQAAVTRWANAGEKFPPTSGWVFSEVERQSQAAAPGFDAISAEIARTLTRALAHELYRPTGAFTPEDTATAVRIMAEAGAHEAVLRFIQEQGLREAWLVPHGEQFPLDVSQQARRRDAMRHYRDVTLPGWRADPSPGLALERARRALEPARRGDLHVIDPARRLGEGA
jgi:hypothetical protein